MPVASLGRCEIDDFLSSRTSLDGFAPRNDGNGKPLVSDPMAGWISLFFRSPMLIAILALR